MTGKVLVLGGTGKTGAPLVRRLIEEGHGVKCASRSGAAPEGAEACRFDWHATDGHGAALDGVGSIYLIAPLGAPDPLQAMQPFIETAIDRGVGRFVLLSSSLLEEGGPAMGMVHAFLRQCAPQWAVLRPSWFMQNFVIDPHLASIQSEGAIYSATDDGLVPFIAAEDIAEVALHALTDAEPTANDLLITGPEAISYDRVAATVSEVAGRAVRHVRLTAEQLAARFEAAGIPSEYATMLAGLDRAIAAGAEARTTDIVEKVTGRPPMSFDSFARAHAGQWSATR